jgi:hypothetical protein
VGRRPNKDNGESLRGVAQRAQCSTSSSGRRASEPCPDSRQSIIVVLSRPTPAGLRYDHVLYAVEFARTHHIELAMRAGGHSHLGWGASNGLLIMVRRATICLPPVKTYFERVVYVQSGAALVGRFTVGPASITSTLRRTRNAGFLA